MSPSKPNGAYHHIHTDKHKSDYQLLLFAIPAVVFVIVLIVLYQFIFKDGVSDQVKGYSTTSKIEFSDN